MAIAEDLLNGRPAQQGGNIVDKDSPDAGIPGARDPAGSQHIPQRDAVAQQIGCFPWYILRPILPQHAAQHLPETVAGIAVVEVVLPG